MEREMMKELVSWKDSRRRKPLLLTGARQVGKTWLLKEFGQGYFENVAYVNFDKNLRMTDIFEGSLSSERLLPVLQAESGERIELGKTLLILDEIQEVPRAIQSLKYFYEECPKLAVAAAGSSLGIELHRGLSGERRISFPVGKVSFKHLLPLSFREFLLALGKEQFCSMIDSLKWEELSAFHDELIELVRIYIYIGGMPDVVMEYVETGDFAEVRRIQNDLLASYKADFSKYAEPGLAERVRLIWEAIPQNLAQENKKFIFKRIKSGARAREFEEGLQWLEDTSLVRKIKRVNAPGLPLSAYQDDTVFKVFCHDVGLLGAMSNLNIRTIIEGDRAFTEFKGALGEQLAFQEMTTCGVANLFYYKNESTRSEIDFLTDELDGFNGIVPIEIKYGTNLRAKSLSAYVKKNAPETAIRVSSAPHGHDGAIEDIPFYALSAFLKLGSASRITDLPEIAERREKEMPESSDGVVDAIVSLLKGSPLSRRNLARLLADRRGIEIALPVLDRALARMKKAGIIGATGYGISSKWELLPKGEQNAYAFIEGEELDTGYRSTSRFGLLASVSDESKGPLEGMNLMNFWFMDSQEWADLVDSLRIPEDEEDEPQDLVAETGIPRDIGPEKAVFDNFGDIVQLVDIDDSLDTLNELLSQAYPDYGYRIVRGGLRL